MFESVGNCSVIITMSNLSIDRAGSSCPSPCCIIMITAVQKEHAMLSLEQNSDVFTAITLFTHTFPRLGTLCTGHMVTMQPQHLGIHAYFHCRCCSQSFSFLFFFFSFIRKTCLPRVASHIVALKMKAIDWFFSLQPVIKTSRQAAAYFLSCCAGMTSTGESKIVNWVVTIRNTVCRVQSDVNP